MGIVVGYSIIALVLLALASGFFKPKRWQELTEGRVQLLRLGCFIAFLVISLNLLSRLFI